jgi:hypothetical protein
MTSATPLASPQVVAVRGPILTVVHGTGDSEATPAGATVLGTVTSNASGALVVDARRSSLLRMRGVAVTVTSGEAKVVRGGLRAAAADITPGSLVLIHGLPVEDDEDHLHALRIHDLTPPRGGAIRGR